MEDENRNYTRKLAITKFAYEEPDTWKYKQDEISTDEGAETIYKEVLGAIATAEGLTEEELLEKYTISVEEHYISRNHTDYIDINDDTYYLYDSLNRLAQGECDKVEVWAYGKEPRYELGDNSQLYEVEDKSLMISAEAIEAPISLTDFVNKKAPIKVTPVVKEEPKKITLADLGKMIDKKATEDKKDELRTTGGSSNVELSDGDAMEVLNQLKEDTGVSGQVEEEPDESHAVTDSEMTWSSSEVDEMVKEAYKEGFKKGYIKGLSEKG